jgi:hypothetical protein
MLQIVHIRAATMFRMYGVNIITAVQVDKLRGLKVNAVLISYLD